LEIPLARAGAVVVGDRPLVPVLPPAIVVDHDDAASDNPIEQAREHRQFGPNRVQIEIQITDLLRASLIKRFREKSLDDGEVPVTREAIADALIKSLGTVDLIGEVQETGTVSKIRRRRIGRRKPAEAVVEIEVGNLLGADDLSEEPAHVAAIPPTFDEITAAAQRAAGGPAQCVEPPRYSVRPVIFV